MSPIPVFLKKYMFLSLGLCRASLPVNMCMTVLIHFHLQLGLELFPFDIILNAAGYAGEQTPGIE